MTDLALVLASGLAGYVIGFVVRSRLAVRQQRRARWQRVEKHLRAERARAVARRANGGPR